MWASTTDSPVIVLQEGDRGVKDVSGVSSWRRDVSAGRPQGDDNVVGVSRFSEGPTGGLRLAVDEESREGEGKRRGRHRFEVGPGLPRFPEHLASRGECETNGSTGQGSGWSGGRRSRKFEGNYHTGSSVRRRILRKHFHSRRDYWQTPVDPEDPSASGGTTGDKAAEEKSVDDMISAALKLFTLDTVVGILNRFRDCSLNKHSVFQLVGPDLAADLATAFVGNSSPWLGVLEQEGAPPKFDAVEGMTADLSSFHLPAEVEGQLKGLDDDSLTPAFFDEFGRNAQQYVASAVAALNGITSNEEKSLNTSVENVVAVCGEMKKALTIDQQTSFKEYLKANLDQWTLLQRNLTSGLDMVKDMMPSIRKLVYSDIGRVLVLCVVVVHPWRSLLRRRLGTVHVLRQNVAAGDKPRVVHVLSALALLAGYEVLEEWLAVAKHATAATLNGAVFCFVARFLTLSTIKASKVARPGVADVLFRLLGTNAAVSLAAWIMTVRDVAAVYRVFRDRPEIVVWHPLLEAKLGVLLARIPLGVSLAFITLFEIDCAFRACAVYCTSMERERKASAERTLQPGHLVDADPSSRSPSTTIGVCGAMLHWIVKYQYPKGLQRTALPGFTAPAARRHLGSGTRLKRSNLEKAANGDI
ncbi:hypothetical protein HPB50_004262 [Hyalomma asiaticum]|uniref:Uncharacterized protein n=1 Tax=Hyalomma asiaticum TaxID=266040 RepID=A0ACB7TAF2_HYAAI|nr:hypothetical protein HPB50_004262 [Hyalomma asiaticum]